MTPPEPVAVDNDQAAAPRFLAIDHRVASSIRLLMDEADGCLNMSFSVGGTACARRAIRMILHAEGIENGDFPSGLAALSEKHPTVPSTLFRILESLTADEDPLPPGALKALIATAKALIYEVYVLGAERIESLQYLAELLKTLDRGKTSTKSPLKPLLTSFMNKPKP